MHESEQSRQRDIPPVAGKGQGTKYEEHPAGFNNRFLGFPSKKRLRSERRTPSRPLDLSVNAEVEAL